MSCKLGDYRERRYDSAADKVAKERRKRADAIATYWHLRATGAEPAQDKEEGTRKLRRLAKWWI